MYAKHFIYTFLALFTSVATWAQFQFKAEVLNNSIGIDQTTEVRFVTNDTKVENFKQPLFENFYVVNKISSNNAQYKNGIEQQFEQNHTFVLSPLRTGDLMIESASVMYQGKVYKTEPIFIQVGNEDVENKRYSWEDLGTFKNSIRDKKYFETISIYKEEEKNVDFRAVVNLRKGNIYVNEFFAVEYGLLVKGESRSAPTNFTYKKLPVYNDSLLVGVIGEKKILFQPEMIKIKSASKELKEKYYYAPLVTYYLKPQQLGTVEIAPVEFEIETTDTITKTVNTKLYVSESKKINIVPFPVENQPKNFSNVFGDYDITLYLYTDGEIDNTHFIKNDQRVKDIKVNERIEIQIVITGAGGLPKGSNVPKPKIISDLEYSLDLKEDYTKGIFIRNKEVASKTYIFTPKQKGKYTISTIDFPYFNTTTNKYTTISTEEIIIEAN